MLRVRPRDYQLDAYAAWDHATSGEQRSALVSMPTGTGKTVVMALTADSGIQAGGRTAIVAERRELLTQLADSMQRFLGIPVGTLLAGKPWRTGAKVVCLSKDSLTPRRLNWFAPNEFNRLIIDEGHHAYGNNITYARFIEHFRKGNARTLGLSATADRSDKGKIIGPGLTYERLAYHYPIFDHRGGPSAIEDGWIVPIKSQVCFIRDLNLRPLYGRANAKEFDPKLVEKIMAVERICHECAEPIVDYSAGKPAIVFCAGIRHVEMMGDILSRWLPGKIAAVHSKLEPGKRDRLMHEFLAGRRSILVNDGVATEGFDYDQIALVALCKPCRTRPPLAQRVGRGLRPLNGVIEGLFSAAARRSAIARSAKPFCRVLSFVGTMGDLSLVADIGTLLAEDGIAGAIAQQRYVESGGTADLGQLVTEESGKRQAEEVYLRWLVEMERIKAQDQREYLEWLRRDGLSALRANVDYGVTDIDLLKANGKPTSNGSAMPGRKEIQGGSLTAKQNKLLVAFGFHPEAVARMQPDYGKGCIDRAFERRESPDWQRLARFGKQWGWLWTEGLKHGT